MLELGEPEFLCEEQKVKSAMVTTPKMLAQQAPQKDWKVSETRGMPP
jgi:hypothetical protein